MRLTEHERERLLITLAADVAERRRGRGLKLNHPEATAILTSFVLELALGAGAAVDWRELIVLGRTGEPAGHATLRWDVTRLGRPVLRQFVGLEPGPALTAGAGLTGGRRVLACALISDPASTPRTVVASPVAVAQRVDDDTLLVSVLDDDAARATRRLGDLCARARA